MANATGIRRSDEPLRTGHGFAEVNADSRDVRGRREQLIATAALEMDRLYERICESGCVLLLTDSDGAILHEKSNAMLKGAFRVQRIGSSGIRSLSPERDVAPVNYKTPQQALTLEDLAGEDPQMLRNVRSAYRIADSGVSVLIQGPTGSGKEAFAHAMHLVSRRADRPFVAVNCAAIPETLIESELFGYKPGAFTGARKEGMRGKILQSAGGTLFLDEIGDMPLTLQTRLLRVLEEQEIVPLGSETAIKVDLHVIAASHRNLREMIANGTFREDLYYRLNGITLELPALRDRADKERVIHHALAAETGNGRPAAIEMDALQRLVAYPWPGNIRELRNVIRTALAICEGGVVRGIDLPREIRESESNIGPALAPVATVSSEPSSAVNPLKAAERAALVRVIAECHGNMTRVAAQLGMSRNTLYRRMKRHAIPLAHGG
jgi:transcriptional regulator of acetoin/glycerol metabolism